MTIPFQAEGQLLPVSPWLKSQLTKMVIEQRINLEPLTALTFRFNDPNYSATQGGYHPVEIRLVRGLWLITSCRSANNIMPITFFLPAFIASFFYSA